MRQIIFLLGLIVTVNATAAPALPKRLNSPTLSYNQVIAKIKKDKISLKANEISKDSCRRYFLDQFENHVFPHWVGTQWDYNGYTNVPGNDKLIACGYFVSTPLKHMGFNWNRYDLAKMYSKKIIESTCDDTKKYTNLEIMIKTVNSKPPNLYIVGLDNHVGFILKSQNRVWFVHSNYIDYEGPVKELASKSPALEISNSYYLGTFLTDKNLDKWLSGSAYFF